MNYLAHAQLSFYHEHLIVGNLIADTIKSKKDKVQLPITIQKGIQLHRFIDTFTDTNKEVDIINRLLHPYFYHYASVVSDIYFDYYLYNNWIQFESLVYESFCEGIYSVMNAHKHIIPEKLFWMADKNWLQYYTTIEGIQSVFDRLTIRLNHKANFINASEVLLLLDKEIKELFLKFYPQLTIAVQSWIEMNYVRADKMDQKFRNLI